LVAGAFGRSQKLQNNLGAARSRFAVVLSENFMIVWHTTVHENARNPL
jgi:hypothetical protein